MKQIKEEKNKRTLMDVFTNDSKDLLKVMSGKFGVRTSIDIDELKNLNPIYRSQVVALLYTAISELVDKKKADKLSKDIGFDSYLEK